MSAPQSPVTTLAPWPSVVYADELRLRAMNTDIHVIAHHSGETKLLEEVARMFLELEATLSRFLPDSDLSILNRTAGVVQVDPQLFGVLRLAKQLNLETGGLFEPAVLDALSAAGYDRSFESLDPAAVDAEPVRPAASIREIELDSATYSVVKPEGVRLDLGGIGKGFAVDRAAEILAPARNFLIDAGGDIFAAGDGEDGSGWLVAVSGPPPEYEAIALVKLKDEALATSTISVRRWHRDGRWFHHIIDPRTGEPSASDVVSASVVAPTTVEAEVMAKVALLLGSKEGIAMLDDRRLAGLLQLGSGTIVTSSVWDQSRAETALAERM